VRVEWFVESTQFVKFYTDTYDLVFVESAQSVIVSGGKMLMGTPGTIMLLGPHTVFSHVAVPVPETVRVLHVPPELVHAARRELAPGARERPRESISRLPEIRDSLVRLHRAFDSDSTPLERQELFTTVLHALMELPSNAVPFELCAVRRAREMLHECFREPMSLSELSRVSGVSPFYLHRSFKRATGVAPHAYQNLLRIANARALLARGVPPCEAAVDSGFCDQSHLTRHFRRAHGLTPAEYARGVRSLSLS
jgi:AraC-like DNA-binding protein